MVRAGVRSNFCCLSSSGKLLKNVDEVTLPCCVWTPQNCSHQVTWFFNNAQVVESDSLKISTRPCGPTRPCGAAVKTLSSHFHQSRKSFRCEIRNESDQTVQTFSFRAPGEEQGQESAEAPDLDLSSLTQVRLQQQQQQQQLCPAEELRTQQHWEVDVMSRCSFRKSHHPSSFLSNSDMFCAFADFWWISVIVAAGLVALLVIVVRVLKRKRPEGETKDLFFSKDRNVKLTVFCLCSHQNEEKRCKLFSLDNESLSFYELLMNHHGCFLNQACSSRDGAE